MAAFWTNLGLFPAPHKLGKVAHACNPRSGEMEAGAGPPC